MDAEVDPVGIFALLFSIFSIVVVGFGLIAGYVPTHMIFPKVRRAEQPVLYWINVVAIAIAGAISLKAAVMILE